MTLRRGRYTVYKRRVYSLHRMDDDCMFVFIDDNKILDDKCIKDKWENYIRPVTPDEIGDIYSVRPYAVYKGHKVALRGRYEYFKGIYKPYKVEDYHVIIKDGELHRHKVE